jgi:DNA repair protein RadC
MSQSYDLSPAGIPIQNGAVIIVTARDAADLLGPLFVDRPGETLAVLYLDADQRLIALDTPPGVGADAVELPIKAIFQAALNHGAAGIVLAHNHPSGDPRPSRADIETTRRLAETAAALDIILHDHLIFAGGECRSFRQMGLL